MSFFTYPEAANASVGSLAQQTTSKLGVAVTGGPLSLFTITGGLVRIVELYGIVSTVIGGTATSVKLVFDSTTDTDLCNATAVTSTAAAAFILCQLLGSGGGLRISTGQGAVLTPGAAWIAPASTINLTVTAGGTTGAVDWYCVWQPLDVGAVLAAA